MATVIGILTGAIAVLTLYEKLKALRRHEDRQVLALQDIAAAIREGRAA